MKRWLGTIAGWTAAVCLIPSAAAMLWEDKASDTAARAVTAEMSVTEISGGIKMLCSSGEIIEMTAEEYAVYAVMGEIPELISPEAMKAQVCAARTYAAQRIAAGTDDAAGVHITDDPLKYQTALTPEEARAVYGDDYDRVYKAVSEAAAATRGEIIIYNGKPAIAAFHTASAGTTETAENVWGTAVPYLTAVDSPDSSPYKNIRREFTYAEITARMSAEFGTADAFDGISVESSPSGTALSAQLCGNTISGDRLARILSLDSAAFTADYDGEKVCFTVNGCGHLAGMSIYGADHMARQGADYRSILSHYYPDTDIGCITG
ncbi:MAG: SpoIID/LytB domain-containing protein [Oscillospiraceae bacterium]|nr:SpoIID/LytB domain-containing protein [Oscillospiraceae bacterium]